MQIQAVDVVRDGIQDSESSSCMFVQGLSTTKDFLVVEDSSDGMEVVVRPTSR
jgi:hypothetical protein